jgi:hypothetical protein
MVVFNRVTCGHQTVRFFFKRADAINQANAHTRLAQQQHNAVHTQEGWLVENAVTKELFDIDGRLPRDVDVGPIRR